MKRDSSLNIRLPARDSTETRDFDIQVQLALDNAA